MRKLIFLLLLIFFPCFDTSAVVIRLYPEAKVSGLRVELGGIADVEDENEEVVKKIKKICLMPLPFAEKIITSEEIQRRISYLFREDVVFIGEKTKIKPVFTRILDTEILEKIRTAALKQYPELSYEKMDISLIDSIQPIKIPYGEIEIKPHFPTAGKINDIKYIRADILVDNMVYTSRMFRVKLTVKR